MPYLFGRGINMVADRENLLSGVGGPVSLSVETMRGGRAAGEDPALGIEEAKDSN